jgi:hypothetical protein
MHSVAYATIPPVPRRRVPMIWPSSQYGTRTSTETLVSSGTTSPVPAHWRYWIGSTFEGRHIHLQHLIVIICSVWDPIHQGLSSVPSATYRSYWRFSCILKPWKTTGYTNARIRRTSSLFAQKRMDISEILRTMLRVGLLACMSVVSRSC